MMLGAKRAGKLWPAPGFVNPRLLASASHSPYPWGMRPLIVSALLALALASCGENPPGGGVVQSLRAPPIPEEVPEPELIDYNPDLGIVISEMKKMDAGVLWQDDSVGVGDSLDVNMTAVVHYTGWLPDGTQFDTSREGGTPFTFRVGAGEVIEAWEVGVVGMRVGGRRKLVVPPALGYGSDPFGPLPGNAILVFEIELIEIRP